MNAFRWLEEPGQLESLAICLRSLTAQAGAAADYDELVAALGLGSLVVADGRHEMGDWSLVARDELLVATAEQWGVRVRDLHPRRAAVGLESSAEFRLHFIDSYMPLIERAVACGQVAVAWRGWPTPHDLHWGVITTCRDGAALGYTMGAGREPSELRSPAQQVYVVEEIAPRGARLGAAERYSRVAWAASAQESGSWCSDPALATGSRAWGCWRDHLLRGNSGDADIRAFCSAAGPVAAARESLARWLRLIAGELSGPMRAAAVAWAEECAGVARRLREAIAPGSEAIRDIPAWRSATAVVLADLAVSETRSAEIVGRDAAPIAVRPAYEPDPLAV